MITVRGSIPFPPCEAAPVHTLASNLKQMSQGLQQSATKMTTTGVGIDGCWGGQAAQKFTEHTAQRANTIDSIASSLASAAVPLDIYASAIAATSTAYSTAAMTENAARAGLPWTAAVLAAAIAAETAAVVALQGAGAACAGALAVIEFKVAAAEYLLGSGGSPATSTNGGGAQASSLTDATRETLHQAGHGLHIAGEMVGAVADGVEGLAKGLERGIENNSQQYLRNGKELLRWTVDGRGTALGMTRTQAVARVASASKWAEGAPVLGAVVSGISQTLDDANLNLTTVQRVGRTSSAVLFEGGGAYAGASAGASFGATTGAAIGVWFGGIGAVPGAAIGGVVGGVLGGIGGSVAGRQLKEWLFQWNATGAFK